MNKEYRLCLDNECSRVTRVSHEALENFMDSFAWI